MAFADANGTRIYYETHGAGPAIMLVHGSGGHHMSWFSQVAWLRSWYTVITIDLRGFGNSDSIEGGPDSLDFAGDIGAVLDHAGVARCVILGQSIGANAALRFAMAQPGRVAAVLLAHATGGLSDPEIATAVSADRHAAEKLPVLDRLLTPRFQHDQPALTFLFQQQGSFNSANIRSIRNMSAPGPSAQQVTESGVRICFLTGERDGVLHAATVQRAHDKLPGSLITIVPDGPHSMYWEMPAAFNQAVRGFLQAVYPETAA